MLPLFVLHYDQEEGLFISLETIFILIGTSM